MKRMLKARTELITKARNKAENTKGKFKILFFVLSQSFVFS
jgi:hypothetical protein